MNSLLKIISLVFIIVSRNFHTVKTFNKSLISSLYLEVYSFDEISLGINFQWVCSNGEQYAII